MSQPRSGALITIRIVYALCLIVYIIISIYLMIYGIVVSVEDNKQFDPETSRRARMQQERLFGN